MPADSASSPLAVAATDRAPPYSEEAEQGVLGSILLDSGKVMDLCVARRLTEESFYVPTHRVIFGAMLTMYSEGRVIDGVTLTERLRSAERLDGVGGPIALERLIDSTPTAAHAEYYIEIVREKHLLRSIISCSREAERSCYEDVDNADTLVDKIEQSFLNITENEHGRVADWHEAVHGAMEHVEQVLASRRGLSGVSTGFLNLDRVTLGLRKGEMIVLAARPSMGKTSLAMNIVENVALGKKDPDRKPHAVGVFSLEMSQQALVLRMLCSRAKVRGFDVARGRLSKDADHRRLIEAASVLAKAPIYLDDTGGLDVLEVRARARRMWKKHSVDLIVVDYLQLLHCSEYARQGRQIETSQISSGLKSMAKELNVPVLVISQLSRAPEQRDKLGKPKLSDLRDSGAIEQDADVVCLLRRPCRYPDDEQSGDITLAIVDVAKQRNGPTGEVEMNFHEDYTLFEDRARGVDDLDPLMPAEEEAQGGGV